MYSSTTVLQYRLPETVGAAGAVEHEARTWPQAEYQRGEHERLSGNLLVGVREIVTYERIVASRGWDALDPLRPAGGRGECIRYGEEASGSDQ